MLPLSVGRLLVDLGKVVILGPFTTFSDPLLYRGTLFEKVDSKHSKETVDSIGRHCDENKGYAGWGALNPKEVENGRRSDQERERDFTIRVGRP